MADLPPLPPGFTLDQPQQADPNDFTNRYNTQLTPAEEQRFQAFAKSLGQRGSTYDYDLRGAFKAGAGQAANGHFPDTFKKPNHPTFSSDSQYSGKDGFQGGSWTKQSDGTWAFTPSASMLQLHSPEELQSYFQRVEPGNKLVLPQQQAQGQIPPLPPGFTLDTPGAPAEQPKQPSVAMAPVGGAEMLLKLGTGALASIPAGIAYGGAAIGKALGADVTPSDVQNRVQNYLTYQPLSDSAKAGEQALANVTAPIVKPIVKYADQAATAVGKVSPVAETMLREAPAAARAASAIVPLYQGAKAFQNARALNAEADALAATAPKSPEEALQAKAKELNVKLLPSQQGKPVGTVAEGISGQAKLERTLSKQNAKAVDAAVAEEVGLPTDQPLTRAALAAKRAEASQVYGEVSDLGQVGTDATYRKAIQSIDDRSGAASFAEDTPLAVQRLKKIYSAKGEFDAADAVAKVRQLRADARANLKAPNAPEQNALGFAQQKVADALDDQLERAAQAAGQTDLVSRYRAARTQLAKIHSVEDAFRGQNVSAKVLSQQLKRGVPLSGKIRDIAELYNNYDRVLQDVSKLRNTGPLDVVDYLVGAGAGIHNPALAAAALGRPIIRGALASDLYQGIKRGPAGPVPPPQAPNALAPGAIAATNALATRRAGGR